jgi:hypothetical protein
MKMPVVTASSPGSIALLLAGALLAGCATSRSEVRLESPSATSAPPAASVTKTVVIRTIKDERVFEESPRDPSIPSLGFEGASKATDDVKSRAVARKRGGFGKAMGDVLLEDGQSVVGLVRENLTAAFKDAGYQVADAPVAGASPLLVDVHIRKFWGWFQPGFWAIALHCNIETQLDVVGGAEPVLISINSEDSRQMATEGAWMEILQQALQTYRTEAKARLLQSPF